MPLRLTPLEILLARLNILPLPLLDAPLAQGISKALVTACELGIFDTLDKQALPLKALAEKLECHPQGLQLLLNLLISAGYLRYRAGLYSNTRIARRWLTSGSAANVAPYVIHSPDIVAIWDHLPEVIRTNQQAMRMPYEEDVSSPEAYRLLARHYAGLAALAMALGGEVVYRVPLPPGASRLLDVGGSHAAYSVLFCRKYAELQATILDIQPGIEAGQRTAAQVQMQERLSFVCGDIVRDDFHKQFPESFDLALYFHIAHLLPAELNQQILHKVALSLKPGGVLAFVDQITDRTYGLRLSSLMVQLMHLTMTTVGGTCYQFSTVRSWLEQAGMEQVRSHRLLTPGAVLITARKKG
ncbi:methyltransferase domain-containing protein [Ktedonosporobacter rubrisoli]|uniref:Methyltransferase domain-containing protein n=1 Tax=Ktedonosporobacter rubrisoli TaxID=2509675 RepID=A0A4V0YZE9_KTERU|nr:class I SAM-dependent methyltransferase [Ktedonosporobacter rubrisoli]QBD79481.1 methyltransferase domain-containing protein [Ktedonosporobacter rubrisoli]